MLYELLTNMTSGSGPIIIQQAAQQILPGISNSQLLVAGQVIIGLLIFGAIMLQLRNMRIGKLLIRDKTIMFAGFINKEDYERVIQEKGHLFRLIPESEINVKELNGHNSKTNTGSGEGGSAIVPDGEGHLKKE